MVQRLMFEGGRWLAGRYRRGQTGFYESWVVASIVTTLFLDLPFSSYDTLSFSRENDVDKNRRRNPGFEETLKCLSLSRW